MSVVILDACSTINLYATGRFIRILQDLKHEWYLPVAVTKKAKYIRQADPADPRKLVPVAIDLEGAWQANVLHECDCRDETELQLYVDLATKIRDDGESMGLAIAKCRGWHVVTDDRKARRIATELGIPLFCTPELLKTWAELITIQEQEIAQVLHSIQTFATFIPNRSLPAHDWWMKVADALPEPETNDSTNCP
jgi:predicted nucleic acid-binding protein